MALQPNPFGKEYLCQKSTALQVKQKYWSCVKNTGRGFCITFPYDDSPSFTIGTKKMGKHRTFQDEYGRILCCLERNFLSKEHAWILTRGSERLLTVHYRCLPWKMTIKMEGSADQEMSKVLEVKCLDTWCSGFVVKLGDWTIMRLHCINMMNNMLSSFKVTPPVWDVDVVEGTDLLLASVLSVIISDAYSEMHLYML
ncbi:hypothetical protein N7474_009156 [Penicillium riverlandense]|uniref:uncharacterized protein n=1 Tax=Penicillium riverlandense TaxID=1903569 RepID=UPI0025479C99|nr:uncharacterized protein N7474_009156 [Penicillium riverlandense]KAJ5807887.1 hypothetical protein N7474_009156 [Penicillium riverlandense]